MPKDLEKLNVELLQAQLLLGAGHELYENILIKTTRCRFPENLVDGSTLLRDIGVHIAKFGQRDEEIRRMLTRLERLGRPAPVSIAASATGDDYSDTPPSGALRAK